MPGTWGGQATAKATRSGRFTIAAIRRRYGTLCRPSTLPFWHPCHGDDVIDRNNRVGRRERFEILKIAQGLGEGMVAVDKGTLRPLRPNTILGALEESIARRTREGRIWPDFLDQFWIGGRVDGADANRADDPQPSRRT
jgi:hypothetical protein